MTAMVESLTTKEKCYRCGLPILSEREVMGRVFGGGQMQKAHGPDACIDRLTAEVAELRRDAERYRWLKANHLQTGTDSWIRTGEDLEEAIDAARLGEQP